MPGEYNKTSGDGNKATLMSFVEFLVTLNVALGLYTYLEIMTNFCVR